MKEWCHHCQYNRAEYRVNYRADQFIPKWSMPNGEMYCSSLCLPCVQELYEQEKKGIVWSVSQRMAM